MTHSSKDRKQCARCPSYWKTVLFCLILIVSTYVLTHFRTTISVSDGNFYEATDEVPNDWFHVIVSYGGPDNAEGFTTYFDGRAVISDRRKRGDNNSPGNGRIVIGRTFTEIDDFYSSMEMDDLVMFNRFLTSEQIFLISALRMV